MGPALPANAHTCGDRAPVTPTRQRRLPKVVTFIVGAALFGGVLVVAYYEGAQWISELHHARHPAVSGPPAIISPR